MGKEGGRVMSNLTTEEVNKTLRESKDNRLYLIEKHKGLSFFKDKERMTKLKKHLFFKELSKLYNHYGPIQGQDEDLIHEVIEQKAHNNIQNLFFSFDQYFQLIENTLNQKEEHLKKISPKHHKVRLSYLFKWLVDMISYVEKEMDYLILENKRISLINHQSFFKINSSFLEVIDETP
jgi:hypothetical protein